MRAVMAFLALMILLAGCSGERASDDLSTEPSACALTLIAPVGDEVWTEGEEVQIRWDATGTCGSEVTIDLWQESGGACATIAECAENDGTYLWIVAICSGETGGYAVRITEPTSGRTVQSPYGIVLQPAPCALEITYPNGGETWIAGETYDIAWNVTGACGSEVKLELLRGGEVCGEIEDATANNGACDWTATQCAAAEDAYRIRVTDLTGGAADESDGVFAIEPFQLACEVNLIAPDGGEAWAEGVARDIRWETEGTCGEMVTIELLTGAGLVCGTIADGADNTGRLRWLPSRCGDASAGYRIRITESGSGATDQSEGTFDIPVGCTLEITSPNGATQWEAGEPAEVAWVESGTCEGAVSIYLYHGTEIVQDILVQGTGQAREITFDLTEEHPEGSDYRVRIVRPGADAFSEPFTIRGAACALEVTEPSRATLWRAGQAVTMRWKTLPACGDQVDAYLYAGAAMVQIIGLGVSNDGNHTFHLAPALGAGTDYRVMVSTPGGNAWAYSEAFAISAE